MSFNRRLIPFESKLAQQFRLDLLESVISSEQVLTDLVAWEEHEKKLNRQKCYCYSPISRQLNVLANGRFSKLSCL
jgi:hypothetical protein